MSLRSTIREIQTRDKDLSAIATNRDEFIAAWRTDVDALYDNMENLLRELVREGSASFSRSERNIKESELGEYRIAQLTIKVANRNILAVPFARLVSGGTGRVDLYKGNRPTERERVQLIRSIEPLSSGWSIGQRNADDFNVSSRLGFATQITALSLVGKTQRSFTTLDRTSLENALDFLLQI